MRQYGFALYGKKGRLFIFDVFYEYPDSQIVGFRKKDEPYMGNLYEIRKDGDKIKIVKIDVPSSSAWRFPIAKKYTQLPGGGGGYKATRQCRSIQELVNNKTVKKIIDGFFIKSEIRKTISNEIALILEKKENKVSYIAALVEKPSEIQKIKNIINDNIGELPSGWELTKFKNGQPDFHMTIRIKENIPFYTKINLVNKKIKLIVDGIGNNENAMALKESGNMYSDKTNKHITIAINKQRGGLPKDSNDIKNWTKIPPTEIIATIRQFDGNKNIIKNISLNERGTQINAGNFPEFGKSTGASRMFPK